MTIKTISRQLLFHKLFTLVSTAYGIYEEIIQGGYQINNWYRIFEVCVVKT